MFKKKVGGRVKKSSHLVNGQWSPHHPIFRRVKSSIAKKIAGKVLKSCCNKTILTMNHVVKEFGENELYSLGKL